MENEITLIRGQSTRTREGRTKYKNNHCGEETNWKGKIVVNKFRTGREFEISV